jgi:hypothetical protein
MSDVTFKLNTSTIQQLNFFGVHPQRSTARAKEDANRTNFLHIYKGNYELNHTGLPLMHPHCCRRAADQIIIPL